MLEFLLEKLGRSVPKWIWNRLEEAKDVLECFCSSDENYVRYLHLDTEQLPVLCAASRESQDCSGRCYGTGKKECPPS